MEQAKNVKLVILDVDGVMTDGRIVIDGNGLETRNFNVKDGMGVVALQRLGIPVAIITSKTSGAVRRRAEELNVQKLYQGAKQKLIPFEEIKQEMGIADGEVCYVGDDLVDLSLMKVVGMPVAVADAVPEVIEAACYVTKARGGHGAVRETAELILKTQGKWDKLLAEMG